jgi:hypothetical protein
MATALHLLKGGDPALATATIAGQLAAGDRVVVVVLPGGSAPPLPAGVAVRHAPDDLSWEALLDEIFAADHVLTW